MTVKRATAIASIDCVLITMKPHKSEDEIVFDTSNQLGVEPSIETEEAVKLIIKGALRAQKPEVSTLTGHTLTLTDNVFTPEVVKLLQGGTITTDEETGKITGYAPPVSGSDEKGEVFDLNAYSAIYDAAGLITGYEKIVYPNCQGKPVAFGAEDGVFRTNSYTIISAPSKGQAPYNIEYVDKFPIVTG